MARTSQFVSVGKRTLELSNLEKVLFPDDHILKAELIAYYLKVAPTILAHVKRRPLSVIRYPDGIGGEAFFQKNRPEWAPDWIEHVALGDAKKTINYIVATEEASLVWLANLACIELHQIHSHTAPYTHPDYMAFDLDPPEAYPFVDVVDLAVRLREQVEALGYHAFAKTTGRKGIHVIAPLEPTSDFDEVFEAAQAIAKSFVEANSRTTTLHIKKDSRKGKVLVDIYRNRRYQTIVSPYSVRGLPGASVSMPLAWDRLMALDSPSEFNIHTVPDHVLAEGDAWQAIAAYAAELHTKRKSARKKEALPTSRKYKTPEQLKTYKDKRAFERTPEPPAVEAEGTGRGFVVHRHHASRLHYDLRLEQAGTLRSWAVPKGLPPRPGIKRLAVQVEDHPLEYLTFEGTIPKGEYGGGEMWVFARGRYEITKQKKNGFYFRLTSREINAEYRMHQTRGNEWLLELVDAPQTDWLRTPVDPMLAQIQGEPPDPSDYLFEVKWDGIRAMITLEDGEIRIRSRSQRDVTKLFPELLVPEQAFRATAALLDAEIVCLDEAGRPVFKHAINRLQQTSEAGIARATVKYPAVCYVFDCLYLDGRPLVAEPIERRRVWLADSIKKNLAYRVSETVDDGGALFDAARSAGLEGIMAKRRGSTYQPGKRSTQWLKIKVRNTDECVIVGYTMGKGTRGSTFGALQIAQYEGDKLVYRGKVGTGFDDRLLKEVLTELKKLKETHRPVEEKPLDDAQTVWVEPILLCEVQYASLTRNGTLREPVFIRLRPDLAPDR